MLANLDSLPQRSASILNGNYCTYTHTYTTWTVQMKCKRQRGEKEELKERQKRKWSVIWKKGESKKSGGYANVKSEGSGGERKYNVLSWPGGHRAEYPGASGGQWPDLSGYHYVEGEVFSIHLSTPPPSISDSISLPGQRWGGLGSSGRWRVRQGELGVGGCR